MANFVKIYASILDSSVWSADIATRIVWIALLAMADQRGHVEAAVPGIARRANVSLEECEAALAVLAAPDAYSKSPEHEGRRIEKDSGGWTILNYQRYRELQTEKQVADADRQRRKRERDMSQTSRDVTPESPHVATEAEAEAEGKRELTTASAVAREDDAGVVAELHITAVYLTVWSNGAVAERWGEQPCPITVSGHAVQLAEKLVALGADPLAVKASIYRQCRISKLVRPPRSVAYFAPGIGDDWDRELARRALRESGERPPPQPGAIGNGNNPFDTPEARALIAREQAEARHA